MICEDCEKDKPDVKETTCPYAEEIQAIKVFCTICDDCYKNRCDDI